MKMRSWSKGECRNKTGEVPGLKLRKGGGFESTLIQCLRWGCGLEEADWTRVRQNETENLCLGIMFANYLECKRQGMSFWLNYD